MGESFYLVDEYYFPLLTDVGTSMEVNEEKVLFLGLYPEWKEYTYW